METVDDLGVVGLTPAIAPGEAGYPRIAYQREGYGSKYAEFNGTIRETEEICSPGMSVNNPDMALDFADRPHIAFCSGGNSLSYAFNDYMGVEDTGVLSTDTAN